MVGEEPRPRDLDEEVARLRRETAELGNVTEQVGVRPEVAEDNGQTDRERVDDASMAGIIAPAPPLDDSESISFEDLFDLADIQQLSDLFAQAFGVASLITRPDGTPITEQSNFTYFCSEFVRKNPAGAANCEHSDAVVGRFNPAGPNIQKCLSAGLCNAGASISVGGRHIANWLIGQVRNETIDDERVWEYARQLGADEQAFRKAYERVPVMPQERFDLVAQTLFVFANQLSNQAYQSVMQARYIAQRKQAEAALLLSEERFKRLIQNSNDIITVVDGAGVLTSLSGPVEKTLGYRPEELIGTSGFQLIHPDDVEPVKSIFNDMLARPDSSLRRAEYRYRHKDGSWVALEAIASNRLHDPIVRGLVLNIRDVSERNRLQDQLQQAMKMEAVGRLAGGVAHDFNNLLTSIIGNVELARQGLSDADPLAQYLDDIDSAAQSAASLTGQLLAFSRKQIIEPKAVSLNDLVDSTRKMLARIIGEDIDLRTVLVERLGSVRIDAGQFERVLVNLAVNARDAMPEGGVLVIETANAELDEGYCARHPYMRPGPYVMLTVSDTGHGMSDEVKQHLFEPFFTTKELGRGTGLGLATTFGAVRQASGSIEVYSEVERGTTFKIFLPMVDEKASAVAMDSLSQEDLTGIETILVVEDEAGLREMVTRILKRFGYHPLQASSGGEALLLAEKATDGIDLLMTDVVMPGINGRELAERLTRLHPRMKVLFTSGYTESVIAHHGVLDEDVNFIAKPYSPLGLARKIREVLGPARR